MRLQLTTGNFGGPLPLFRPGNTPEGVACDAIDVDLSAGTLRGFRTPEKISDDTGTSLFVDDCCVMTGECIDWARPDPLCGHLFRKAKGGHLERAEFTGNCPTSWCRVGFETAMPAPIIEPVAELSYDRSMQSTSVVYTIKGPHGESAPSYPSRPFDLNDGDQVLIVGLPTDYPAEYCATEVCIYMSRAGNITGKEESGNADYFKMKCVPLGSESAMIKFGQPGEALGSKAFWEPPPAGLRDLASWHDGQMAGLDGPFLRFSERRFHQAWPPDYRMAFYDNPIRFIVGRRTGYVLTDGAPAVVKLDNNCENPFCHAATTVDDAPPILSAESAAIVGDSVVYASEMGLVLLEPNSTWRYISETYFDQRAWENLGAASLRGVVHKGMYFGSTDDRSFVMRLTGQSSSQQALRSGFMWLSMRANAFYKAPDGHLYFTDDEGTWRWDTGDDYMPWSATYLVRADDWTTMYGLQAELAYPPVTAKVRAMSGCTRCDGGEVISCEELIDCEPIVIPDGCSGRVFAIELSGKGEMLAIRAAESPEELEVAFG